MSASRLSFAATALLLAVSGATSALAEGPLDFLLRPLVETNPSASFPTREMNPRVPMSLTVRPRYSGLGGGTVFCVRMCDGRYFPIQRGMNVNPAKLCNSMCPASQTKLFAGSDISRAVAADGARYTAIEMAYRYRDENVENCTCNGRTSYGLVGMDASNDPTLRAGDLVATTTGLVRSVPASKLPPKNSNTDEVTSALPLGLRGRASESETSTEVVAAAPTAPEIAKPVTRASSPKRFHDMFAQRQRAR